MQNLSSQEQSYLQAPESTGDYIGQYVETTAEQWKAFHEREEARAKRIVEHKIALDAAKRITSDPASQANIVSIDLMFNRLFGEAL